MKLSGRGRAERKRERERERERETDIIETLLPISGAEVCIRREGEDVECVCVCVCVSAQKSGTEFWINVLQDRLPLASCVRTF